MNYRFITFLICGLIVQNSIAMEYQQKRGRSVGRREIEALVHYTNDLHQRDPLPGYNPQNFALKQQQQQQLQQINNPPRAQIGGEKICGKLLEVVTLACMCVTLPVAIIGAFYS